jgi:hypothetical protein
VAGSKILESRPSLLIQDDEEIEEREEAAEMLDNFELYKRMNPIKSG